MSPAGVLVALDLATVCGVGEIDLAAAAQPRFYSVRFAAPDDDHPETFTRCRRWIDGRLSVGDVAALYVEAPVSAGALQGQTNANTVYRLTGLSAVVAAAAGVWRVKYRLVNVQAARQAFLGNGRLRGDIAKPRAMEMARAIGWDPNNLDEADAAAVLHFGIAREAPKLVPLISPMLQHQVATAAENAKILRDVAKRERSLGRAAR